MREEDFIPCDRSKKMKAIGFNEPCLRYFWSDQSTYRWTHKAAGNPTFHRNSEPFCMFKMRTISQPSFEQAFGWFRYNYHYLSYVFTPYEYNTYYYGIRNTGDVLQEGQLEMFQSDGFKSYEEARLACLDKLIEIVEQNKKQ